MKNVIYQKKLKAVYIQKTSQFKLRDWDEFFHFFGGHQDRTGYQEQKIGIKEGTQIPTAWFLSVKIVCSCTTKALRQLRSEKGNF